MASAERQLFAVCVFLKEVTLKGVTSCLFHWLGHVDSLILLPANTKEEETRRRNYLWDMFSCLL